MTDNQLNRLNDNNEPEDINLTVRIYNIFILIVDIIVLLIKFNYYILESIVLLFVKAEEVDVRDEIVLITGCGHGIGKQTAINYGKMGAKVVCWDINEKTNLETVQEIKSQGGKAYHYVCDVLKRDDIIKTCEQVKREVGIVTILINNAGIMPCHTLLKHTEAEIRTMFELNVLAHFWLIQTLLPDMIERNHGHIVALSSCAGMFGIRNIVPYCGSKFAVRGIMKALQEELRHDERSSNIKLTTILPYMVDTGLCKKPRFRFPSLMKLVTIEETADAIVEAQRRGLEEVSVPKYLRFYEILQRITPRKSDILFQNFIDTGVDSDL